MAGQSVAVRVEFLSHCHEERNLQGVGNVLLVPQDEPTREGRVECTERLGGLLELPPGGRVNGPNGRSGNFGVDRTEITGDRPPRVV